MHGDSNRDQEAFIDALGDAIAEASQGGTNNWAFAGREHAPSGFELESNLDDLRAMYELRSSVAGKNDNDEGSDDEYVNKSEYEVDVDFEDMI